MSDEKSAREISNSKLLEKDAKRICLQQIFFNILHSKINFFFYFVILIGFNIYIHTSTFIYKQENYQVKTRAYVKCLLVKTKLIENTV